MDWLEFFSSLIGSLAWPIVTLIVVVMLRGQIKDLATRIVARLAELTELSAPGGINFKFAENTDEILREIDDVSRADAGVGAEGGHTPPALPQVDATQDIEVTVSAEVEVVREPLAVVLDAYQGLEVAAREALARYAPDEVRRNVTLMVALKTLQQRKIIRDPKIVGIADDLRMTRNDAVHVNPRISADDARKFAEAAHWLTLYLNTLDQHSL